MNIRTFIDSSLWPSSPSSNLSNPYRTDPIECVPNIITFETCGIVTVSVTVDSVMRSRPGTAKKRRIKEVWRMRDMSDMMEEWKRHFIIISFMYGTPRSPSQFQNSELFLRQSHRHEFISNCDKVCLVPSRRSSAGENPDRRKGLLRTCSSGSMRHCNLCWSLYWRIPTRSSWLKCLNYVRISLTDTVRSLSSRWVEGTKYPPILATKFTRSDESTSPLLTADEDWECFLTCKVAFSDVVGERGGAPMTWTIACVSTLWISIVLLGRRDVI